MSGEILKNYREANELTQSDLAALLKCSQDMVSKVEKGDRNPPDKHNKIISWCEVLGCTPEQLRPDIYGTAAA